MTISKEGNIISMNVRKWEFDVIYSLVKEKEHAKALANVMVGYYDTFEED
jgi:hypothetical protein